MNMADEGKPKVRRVSVVFSVSPEEKCNMRNLLLLQKSLKKKKNSPVSNTRSCFKFAVMACDLYVLDVKISVLVCFKSFVI
ncbi:hypothetical protein YC2023_052357 [Brassica napus]